MDLGAPKVGMYRPLSQMGELLPPAPPQSSEKSPPRSPPLWGGTFQISKSEKSPPRSPPNPKIWLKSPPHMGGSHFWAGRLRRPKIFGFPFENCQKSSKKTRFFSRLRRESAPPHYGGDSPQIPFWALPPTPLKVPPKSRKSPPYGGDFWGGVLPPSPSRVGGSSPPPIIGCSPPYGGEPTSLD